jgi:adenosylmethionine-8-amino-7-oxononanoate aminotransferase
VSFLNQSITAVCAKSAVMQILDAEYLVQRVDEMGRPFGEKLQGLLEYPWVGDVRSLGLIGAIEFVVDKKTRAVFPRDKKFGARLTAALREHGILSRVVRGHIFQDRSRQHVPREAGQPGAFRVHGDRSPPARR